MCLGNITSILYLHKKPFMTVYYRSIWVRVVGLSDTCESHYTRKREGRARSRITLAASFRRKKSDLIAVTEDRIQYGARLIARRRDNVVTPNFGNSSVALFTEMELDFLKSDDWIDNVSRLAELASAGVVSFINFQFYITKIMLNYSKKNANNKNESGLTVWYNEASPTWSRESSLDKENRPSVKARAGPVSRQLEKVYGFTCPFTRKIFDTLSQLVEYLNLCYPSLRFQVQVEYFQYCITIPYSVDASSVKFDVFSNVSLAEWAKPPGRSPSEVVFCRPRKKQLEKCGSILSESSKKKSKYQVVKMIENTEMPFVMPVPGPISTKVYHSVAGNTSKWMDHIMERVSLFAYFLEVGMARFLWILFLAFRLGALITTPKCLAILLQNIRDYIDVTPAEKEFMLLFNRFRMDYKRELNGKRLKYQFS
uniref:Transmembrane protein n=1 Tax=Heterorhabditis bacteriophora TaxID=37862 RepID=A0A1I7WWT7_HETBA